MYVSQIIGINTTVYYNTLSCIIWPGQDVNPTVNAPPVSYAVGLLEKKRSSTVSEVVNPRLGSRGFPRCCMIIIGRQIYKYKLTYIYIIYSINMHTVYFRFVLWIFDMLQSPAGLSFAPILVGDTSSRVMGKLYDFPCTRELSVVKSKTHETEKYSWQSSGEWTHIVIIVFDTALYFTKHFTFSVVISDKCQIYSIHPILYLNNAHHWRSVNAIQRMVQCLSRYPIDDSYSLLNPECWNCIDR